MIYNKYQKYSMCSRLFFLFLNKYDLKIDNGNSLEYNLYIWNNLFCLEI